MTFDQWHLLGAGDGQGLQILAASNQGVRGGGKEEDGECEMEVEM